ncbi:MAG: transposase [Acidobacteriota bacterium]
MNYEYDYNDFPLAYLLTLRTYGTWLHGDERLSVERHGFNIYGTPKIEPNPILKNQMAKNLKHKPLLLDDNQRKIVATAIKDVCNHRGYDLQAINVRSNHLHCVVSAQKHPKLLADASKSYATRHLRQNRLIDSETKVWTRGRSRRYLWKLRHVSLAIAYVLYDQGDIIPAIFDCPEFDD